jgi:predicted transcriptional regulator
MSDNFWEMYRKAKSSGDVLECYYQFSKNQCTIIETLLENLKLSLNEDHLKEDLHSMLKDAFTF